MRNNPKPATSEDVTSNPVKSEYIKQKSLIIITLNNVDNFDLFVLMAFSVRFVHFSLSAQVALVENLYKLCNIEEIVQLKGQKAKVNQKSTCCCFYKNNRPER